MPQINRVVGAAYSHDMTYNNERPPRIDAGTIVYIAVEVDDRCSSIVGDHWRLHLRERDGSIYFPCKDFAAVIAGKADCNAWVNFTCLK